MQHIFSLEVVGADEGALLRERVAGACYGSKFPRVYRPLQHHSDLGLCLRAEIFLRSLVRYRVEHEKPNSISPSNHALFSMYLILH